MKTTAKYILSLRRLAQEVFASTSNYHPITQQFLIHFNVTETEINGLINTWNNYTLKTLSDLVINSNLVIDVMDYKRFKDDIAMWRKAVNLYQQWVDELKEQNPEQLEFKSKEELENN